MSPTTSLAQRSATPVRMWVPWTCVPALVTLAYFWASVSAPDEQTQNTYTALTLTFLGVTCVVGPLVCLAWRCRELARLADAELNDLARSTEDELNDLRFRAERAEADNKALSQVVETLARTLHIPDHVPPEWR